MKREIKKYLYDVKTSIDSIYEFLGDKRDFYEYQKNKLLRRGIEREIEIIGEAVNQILKLDADILIEGARQIVDTRNWVIHGYDKVDDIIIWGIIINHIPKLKKVSYSHRQGTLNFAEPGCQSALRCSKNVSLVSASRS